MTKEKDRVRVRVSAERRMEKPLDTGRSVTSLPNAAPHALPVKRRKVPGNDVAWRSFDRILAGPWPKGKEGRKGNKIKNAPTTVTDVRRHISVTASNQCHIRR